MSTELYRSRSAFHDITVSDEDGVITLRFGGRKQSTLDGASGIEACQPYINHLHLPVAAAQHAESALLIGLGGGVLAKRMWHDYPDMRIDVIEIDPEVVEVSRRFFGLPDDERLRIIVGDGRAYLERTDACYDVIVIDAYFEALAPYALVTEEFFRLVAERVNPGGAMAYNAVAVLLGRGSRPFHRFLKGIAATFGSVYVFPVGSPCGGGRENIVVVATHDPLDATTLRDRVQVAAADRIQVPGFAEMADRMIAPVLPRGMRALADAEAPGDGLFHT